MLIPETEARRAKLDTDSPLWVMVDEVNYDILETSYTLEDRTARGQFSPAFSKQIVLAFGAMRDARCKGIAYLETDLNRAKLKPPSGG